jgi:ABC-type amino acid transport substrate-binding protein
MWLAGCRGTKEAESLTALAKLAQKGDLKIGFIPYYEIATEQGAYLAPTGFLTDVFKLFAERAQIALDGVKWRQMNWDSFAPLVSSGAVDLSIAGTFVTPARASRVAFTVPLFALGNGAAVRSGDGRFAKINNVLQLDQPELTVAVVSGEQSAEFVQAKFKHAKIKMLDGPDLAAAPRAVQQGRADVAMSDQFILSRYIAINPDLTDILRARPFSVLPISWAIQQGNSALLDQINSVLTPLLNSPEYTATKKRYPMIPFASEK